MLWKTFFAAATVVAAAAANAQAGRPTASATETKTLTKTSHGRTAAIVDRDATRTLRPVEPDQVLPVEAFDMKYGNGGTFLQLDFRTTAPAASMIFLGTSYIEPVQTADGWSVSGSPQRFAGTNTGVQHTAVVKDLQPGQAYFIVILLNPSPEYDLAGWKPYHTFWYTLERKATVAIPYIYVMDDSDDLSAGDLAFKFQIGPKTADFTTPGNSWDFAVTPVGGNHQINSGEGFWPGIVMEKEGVGDELKLTTTCNDYDSMYAGQLNTPDVYRGTGDTDLMEWNSGYETYDISGGTEMSSGATLREREEFEKEFVLTVYESNESCLEFQLWGSILVTYE